MTEPLTMSVPELAQELGMSTDTLYELLRQGRVPAHRRGTDLEGPRGRWMILRTEIRAWIERGCPGLGEPTRAAEALRGELERAA